MSKSNTDIGSVTHGSRRLRRVAVCVVALSAVTLALWALSQEFHWFETQHTAISELRRAKAGDRVRIAAAITFIDRAQRTIYIQDSSAGLQLPIALPRVLPKLGDHVELRTVVLRPMDLQLGFASMQFAPAEIQSSARGSLPPAEPVALADLAASNDARNARRIKTQGIVRAAARNGDRLTLELADGNEQVRVVVLDASQLDPQRLIDARLKVLSTLQLTMEPGRELLTPMLWVSSPADLVITSPPAQIPLAPSLRAMITEPHWMKDGHRARLRARVASVESQTLLMLENEGLTFPALVHAAGDVHLGDVVEVEGWPTRVRFTVTFQDASVRRVASDANTSTTANVPVLTSMNQVRMLTNTQAQNAYAVDLEAVLTVVNLQRDCFFVQVGQEGIYVDSSHQPMHGLRSGDRIRLRGLTWPGGFSPVIIHPRVDVLGPGELPAAAPVDPVAAPSGIYDSRWVQIEGLVRPIAHTSTGYLFTLQTQLGPVSALLVSASSVEQLQSLVDARVRVTGVFATSFTKDRVLTGYRMFIGSPDRMQILVPPVAERSSVGPRKIKDLLRYSSEHSSTRKSRVQGMVVLTMPMRVYVEDDTGSVEIIVPHTLNVQAGDAVEVVGYPMPTDHGPVMTDATVEHISSTLSVAPHEVTAEEVLKGNFDNRLVTIKARLVSQARGAGQQTLC